MGEEILHRIVIERRAPARPVAALIRFARADTRELARTLPFILEEPVTHVNGFALPRGCRAEIVCADADAEIAVSIAPRGALYRAARALSVSLAGRRARRRRTRGGLGPRLAPPPAAPGPSVSIIIPTRDRADLMARAATTLFLDASYPDKELVIVDNGSVEADALALFADLGARDDVVVVRRDEPFNFARLVNAGARAARGEVLAFVNNDVEARASDWLDSLAQLAVAPDVGAIGPKLVYPDGRVQHAGVALGIGGLTGHPGRGFASDDPGPEGMLETAREVSAVTGACLVTSRAAFELIGGFDEAFVVEFNDIDYCLRLREQGKRILYAPRPVLIHDEGATRSRAHPLMRQVMEDQTLFMRRWGRALPNDPFYPPHLTLRDESLAPAARPRG